MKFFILFFYLKMELREIYTEIKFGSSFNEQNVKEKGEYFLMQNFLFCFVLFCFLEN